LSNIRSPPPIAEQRPVVPEIADQLADVGHGLVVEPLHFIGILGLRVGHHEEPVAGAVERILFERKSDLHLAVAVGLDLPVEPGGAGGVDRDAVPGGQAEVDEEMPVVRDQLESTVIGCLDDAETVGDRHAAQAAPRRM
jgi:hypothetical protein